MVNHPVKKEYFKRWVAYFTFFCLILASQQPSKLSGQDCCCVSVDEEDAQRSKTAKIVAGATVVAFVAGIACIACGTCGGGKHHSHHHSSSGSYGYYNFDYVGNYLGETYNDYSHNHHHHGSGYYNSSYSYSSSFGASDGVESLARGGPQIIEHIAEGNLPARSHQMVRMKKNKEYDQISGVFVTHPSLSAGKGSVTAFVQMPDGTTQTLGSLPFSATAGSSLSYGPFTQKGNYSFRIRVDEGTILSSQTKVGSVEVNVNGSTVESRDFFVPAHVSGHYEPVPCEYAL